MAFKIATCFCLGVALMFDACSPAAEKKIAVESKGDITNYFTHQIKVTHARHFTVSYHNNYKIVTCQALIRSGEQSSPYQDKMVLVQRGTPQPELTGELQGASVIWIPARTVAVNIESGEAFLGELGLRDSIVAVGGLISFDDSLRERAKSGRISQVGYSWHQPPIIDILLARKPDAFFSLTASLEYRASLGKCRELGIPTVPVFSWAEEHYLGQAEWIKFYSLFFNEEETANRIFDSIIKRVDDLKQKVAKISPVPTAMWGYYAGKDRWMIHQKSIEAQFLSDAGLINAFADPGGPTQNSGTPLSTETVIDRGKNVDHWIIGDVHSAALPNETVMSSFASWRNGNLYHNMKRSKPADNAWDWYGLAEVRPDLVLADLVKLTHPGLIDDHQLVFLGTFDKSMKFPIEEGSF